MQPARKTALTALLASALLAASATAASATNLYVATSGSDANSCTSAAAPCLTLQKAVEDARLTPGSATIFVAAGTYNGSVKLTSSLDSGDAVIGAGRTATVLTNTPSDPTVAAGPVVAFRLENLTVKHETADSEPAVQAEGGSVTLKNVAVDATGTVGESAVFADDEFAEAPLNVINSTIADAGPSGHCIESEGATLAVSGSTVETSAEKGEPLEAALAPASITSSTIVARGSEGRLMATEFTSVAISRSTLETVMPKTEGVTGNFGNLSVTGSRVIERASEESAVEQSEGSLTLAHDTFEVAGASTVGGVEGGSLTMTSDTVRVNDATSTASLFGVEAGGGTLRKVNVSGPWGGPLLTGLVTTRVAFLESNLNDGSDDTAPAVELETVGPTLLPLLVQRSRVIAGAAAPADVELLGSGALALDSSLLQGGIAGLKLVDDTGAKKGEAVISASTIDAGTPGLSGETGVTSIEGELSEPGRTLNVDVEGSVLFEPMTATLIGGTGLSIGCQNTDAPSQSQAATPTTGAISCRSGVHGNENLPSPSSIFSSPITSYVPKKRGRLVDSVPSDTISIGYGIKPAPYDLAGHKRDEYGRVGRKCELVQDRGALQMSGQKATCKPKKRKRRRRRH
ncbi:MAG TPA: hypothetical protein VMA83_06215 [Solirubrobacteraceae bacterium]|nr:hypothetical protein [Solirubrobacteraceae bacterium]